MLNILKLEYCNSLQYNEEHDKRRTQLLVNLHWLLIDLRIDFKRIFLTVFIKTICYYLIETKTPI